MKARLNVIGDATAGGVEELLNGMGGRARAAAAVLANAPTAAKNTTLHGAARVLRQRRDSLMDANRGDVSAMKKVGAAPSMIDRGTLNPARVEAMAASLEEIAALPDPVGSLIASWARPNGLQIQRVRTPLGVLGVIFESRPNVTADAGGLCLKSGNAVILRGGSDTHATSAAIHACLIEGLREGGLPADAIQLVPTRDRAAVGAMLAGLHGTLDVIVPRGGRSLVERVQREARVPVFAHLEGVCHVFIHAAADLEMAKNIVVNAKMRRTGVCGSVETLLVDKACARTHLRPLLESLREAGCALRGDAEAQRALPGVTAAIEEDWYTEYLDAVIAVRVVEGLDAAMQHIATYGSQHTDAIVTGDTTAAARFLAEVDSAIVVHNASTQFADGGEFGMGAEIGIATGRMHARGPIGVEQLTSFKYRVLGDGQIRP